MKSTRITRSSLGKKESKDKKDKEIIQKYAVPKRKGAEIKRDIDVEIIEIVQSEEKEKSIDGAGGEKKETPEPKMDIEEFYRSKGVSLSNVRRMSRNYVRYDGPADCIRVEDLPVLESAVPEKIISPAILAAEMYRKTCLTYRPLPGVPTEEEAKELLNRLRLKRRVNKNEENIASNTKRNFIETPIPPTDTAETEVTEDDSFPEMDEYLNDSIMIQCTQAAEAKFLEEKKKQMRISDSLVEKPEVPVSPLEFESFEMDKSTSCIFETPKRYSSKNRSNMLSNSGTPASVNCSVSSNSSFFEFKSSSKANQLETSPIQTNSVPRKSLFPSIYEHEPLYSNAVGDFQEDEDDDMYSQIEMEPQPKYPSTSKKSENRNSCGQSVLCPSQIDESDSSMLSSTFWSGIDELEDERHASNSTLLN